MESGTNRALSDMDARVTAILKSGGARSQEAAIAKVASSGAPGDQVCWLAYKQAATHYAEATEPQPSGKSEALLKLEKKARKLAKSTGMSEASAFAAVYTNPRYAGLVDAEKAAHLARSEVMVVAPRAPARTAYEQLQQEREAHIAKARAAPAGDNRRGESPAELIIAIERALGCARPRAAEIAAQIQRGELPRAVLRG